MPGRTLSEAESKALLASYGVPVAPERLVSTPDEAAAAAAELGFPVVAKLCGDRIAHKTERGLVRLNLASPDAESIPWLLIKAVSHTGNGVLSRATSIQRINTEGGKAPASECDLEHVDQEVRVPYSADYRFYGPK